MLAPRSEGSEEVERRVRQFDFHPQYLIDALSERPTNETLSFVGIPAGSKIVSTHVNHDLGVITLYVEHESFELRVTPTAGTVRVAKTVVP